MVVRNETLHVSELVSTLNGDNHLAILTVLKKFQRTLKKERQIALAVDGESTCAAAAAADDDDDWHGDEIDLHDTTVDPDATEPPAKKYKRSEEWKEDTASYHVPFVGTAVARGEQAKVVTGEWPTGLVKAYLESSPLALELLNDDFAPDGPIHKLLSKKKKIKLSRAICKAHQLAIAELLTVAIPKNKLRESSSGENEEKKFGDDVKFGFMKGFKIIYLPRLFKILNDETERGRGKTGEAGGCGLLVASALRVLKRFAMISTSNSRLVARYLDESLRDGVLRVCLRPLCVNKVASSISHRITNSKPPRTEAIRLATCLLDANDAAVNAYICTGGSKERKVKPGLLFIALREGLAASPHSGNERSDDDDYKSAVTDMLQHLRISMFNESKLTNLRLFFHLIARDPLQHLCRLSSYAPPLTNDRSFITVLDLENDEEMDVNNKLKTLGVEARRLLFPLLCDQSISPFLSHFGNEYVARSMVRILDLHSGIGIRHFLLYCTKKNPSLIGGLFKLLAIPDSKNTFGFISRASFISFLLRKCPSPGICLSSIASIEVKRDISIQDILSILLPVKLKGHFLAKSLQNGNDLVRLESFKLIMSIMKRLRSLMLEGKKRYKWNDDFIDMLASATFKWLPDIQILLSLRNRFDVVSGNRCGAILSGYLFRVIETYIVTLPSLVESVTFDWMKILPSEAFQFNQYLPFLQVCILNCLKIIIKSSQRCLDHLFLSSKIIFEVMLSTKNKQINSKCRNILSRLMSAVLLRPDTNFYVSECIREEISLWIDGISGSTLSTFFKLFGKILNNSSIQLEFLGKAWKIYQVPKIANFSNLIVMAFSSNENFSQNFAFLVVQVAARRLISLRDPLSFAAVTMYADKAKSFVSQSFFFAPLVTYAQALLHFRKEDNKKRISFLTKVLRSYFDNNSPYTGISSFLVGEMSFDAIKTQYGRSLVHVSPKRLIAFIKFLNHAIIFSGGGRAIEERYWQIIQKLIPSVLMMHPLPTSVERKLSSLLADIYAIQKQTQYSGFDKFDLLILSCPFSLLYDFIKLRKSVVIDAVFKSRNTILLNSRERSKLLCTCLVKNNLKHNNKEKIQLSLISNSKNMVSNLCLQFLSQCFGIEHNKFGKQFPLEDEVIETAVKAWVWVGEELREYGKPIHRQIKGNISSMLMYSLQKDGIKSACIMSLFGNYPESMILDLCLDFSIEETKLVSAEIEFLKSILRIYSYRFIDPMISRLKDMGPRTFIAWEAGYLDDSVSILLRQINSSPEMKKPLLEIVSLEASKRFANSQASILTSDPDRLISLINLMCAIFDVGNTTTIETHMKINQVTKSLAYFFGEQKINSHVDGIKSVCHLGIRLLEYLKIAGKQSEELTKQLSLELFHFLFASLPRILKNYSTSNGTTPPSDLVLTWLIHLIKENRNYLFSRSIETSVCQKVFRACLKHGIATEYGTNRVSTLSLHFIGLLMIELFHKNCFVTTGNPTAEEIFNMIVSHSKFKQLFTDVENEEEEMVRTKSTVREHLLRLIIICVMTSTEDIEIKPVVWKAIFASFNAGVNLIDCLIRNLVTISCKNSLPFMDELRWKGCDMNDREQILTGNLDWLIDALEVVRIRATASRFPVFDTLDLAISLDNIWVEQPFCNMIGSKESSREEHQSSSDFLELKKQNKSIDFSTKDRADTEPYGPAFLLPLVLKSIEVGLIRNKEKISNEFETTRTRDEDKQESISPWNFSKSSIESIQRLCEKDIVSLCLASLSSLCGKVRCYSVSILGLILRACQSKYALNSPSWRDRPQLVMILNSIQRSFVLKKALDNTDSIVPRVTPLVATFLARSAMVLSKPDDALYVPINRYFLKNEANHGAFQDMNRVPAFMSLFCSSSEDFNQSRAERMWGLRMLNDGLVDAACYKLVTSCHAPELILSSLENIRLSQASDEAKGAEICLLLGSIKSMIDHGGYGAHAHLIRRCGLLSWMRSICNSNTATTAFPTERTKVSFCQLIQSVVEKVFCTRQLQSYELIDEMCSLIEPIVSWCTMIPETKQLRRVVHKVYILTLRALAICLQSMKDEKYSFPEILSSGVSLEKSLCVLSIVDDSAKELLLRTLCCLPLALARDQQQEVAQELIVLMLDCFCKISNRDECESSEMIADSGQLIDLLLRRVLLLIEHCKISLATTDPIGNNVIVTKIFALRCNSRYSELTTRTLWSRCLELLTQKALHGTDIGTLDRIICNELCR